MLTILANDTKKPCYMEQDQKKMFECIVRKFSDDFYEQAWNRFKKTFEKEYEDLEEEKKRKEIFKENYIKTLVHNLTNSSYKQDVNNFSDLTEEEFEDSFLTDFSSN